MTSELPPDSPATNRSNLDCRAALAKPVDQRTYDDLIAIKCCVGGIESLHKVLADLHPWKLDELLRLMSLEVYQAGDVIFNQGDRGDKFYIVLDGEVEISQLRSKAKPRIEQKMTVPLHNEELQLVPSGTASSGEYFGERALECNEPRSESAKALTKSDLIVIATDTYKTVLSAAVEHVDTSKQLNFKGICRQILMKKRSARTEEDLQTLAEYFTRRVCFFRSMRCDSLIDICRALELITIHGKATIFRQNSIGQGFYIILTGVVEIRVATQDKNGNYVDIPVNSLREGFSFGGRAMENRNCVRMGTALAAEDFTELLVLNRHDYHQFLAPLYAEELETRSKLLTRTVGFQGLSLACREELVRFMEPRYYRIDQAICTSDSIATEIFVICRGEAAAFRNVHVDGHNNTTKTARLLLGKVGPGTMIGDCLVLADTMSDEVITQEDVTATTLCKVYVFGKFDLLHRVSAATLQALRDEIMGLQDAPSLVYDTIAPSTGRAEWSRRNIWGKLKTSFAEQNHIDFQGKRHMLSSLVLTTPSKQDDCTEPPELNRTAVAGNETPVASGRLSDARLRSLLAEETIQSELLGSRSGGRVSASSGRPHSRRSSVSKGSASSNSRGRPNELHGAVSYASAHSYNPRELQRYPCCLVHLYREKLRLQAVRGSKKHSRCFLRLLGGFSSADDAKAAVRQYFNHVTHTLGLRQTGMHSSQTPNEEPSHALMSTDLAWQPFKGWDMFGLHHSDHFVIYAKDGPVEYLSDTIRELHLQEGAGDEYPIPCRPRGQKFACVHIAKLSTSTYSDPGAKKAQRLFLKELSAFAELHAVTRNKADAMKYTQHLTRLSMVSSYEGGVVRVFTIPLFRWVHLNDDALSRWEGKMQFVADDASINIDDADPTFELKRLLAESGLSAKDGNYLEYVEAPKWLRSTGASDEASSKYFTDMLNEKSKAKLTNRLEEKRVAKTDSDQAANVEWIESAHEKVKHGMQAHRMLCEARTKIVRMSNELSKQEELARSLSASDQLRGSKGDMHQLMSKLNRKQWEVLNAISELPDRKALLKSLSRSSKVSAGQLAPRPRFAHTSSQQLSTKLDALDDMLRNELRIQCS